MPSPAFAQCQTADWLNECVCREWSFTSSQKLPTVPVPMNHTLLPVCPPLGCHIGFTRGWEVQHSMLVVPTLGKSHRHGVISHHGSLLRFLPLSPSPNLDPTWSFFSQCSADYMSGFNINYSTSSLLSPPPSLPPPNPRVCSALPCSHSLSWTERRRDKPRQLPCHESCLQGCQQRSEEGWALGRGEGKGFSVVVRKWAQGGVGAVWEH